MEKYLILVIDGCAPEYLTRETAPQLWELAQREGFAGTALGAVPTVTNVNHACILSGRFPEETGVVGNYYYRPDTGKHGFVEEQGFMKAPTLFQAVHARGGKSALLTVKGKVLGVYGDDVDIGLSAQSPDPGLLRRLGLDAPPSISDIACTRWILEAALACVRREDPELIYCTTNDYGFHHYAPGTPEALRQIGWVDEWIAAIHQADPDRRIYITADHGMNQKHRLVDIQRIADHRGIPLFALAPLKDRYIENHIYQEGGILYLYLKDPADSSRLLQLMAEIPEVAEVLPASEAARRCHLPTGSIGDYVLFAAGDCAFGELPGDSERLVTDAVRTHGSLFEQTVPLLAIRPLGAREDYRYSKDIGAAILRQLESAN
ncbi:MAG: alkaline phosphatase family protein [Clostridiales bacterium]|nr:alkaline phosphatase family protein [Clostridiales bacterium]